MPTQSSGPISIKDVSGEVGLPPVSQNSLNGALSRRLAGVYSGPISLGNMYGRSLSGSSAQVAGQVELLVVAGGGGGGRSGDDGGGGGGAGGLLSYTTLSFTTGDYAITVGAGGPQNTNGTNSSALGYVAIGGGKGGTGSGGSGGGGNSTNFPNPGAGTSGQGNNGGGAYGGHYSPGGGGGGAGGVGGTAGGPGPGGIGLQIAITGTLTYYAGGGGGAQLFGSGAAGGAGGGGTGGGPQYSVSGSPGTNGLGGGGGGGPAGNVTGGTGGSGVVIIAYPGTSPIAVGGTISTTSRPGYVVHTFLTSGIFSVY